MDPRKRNDSVVAVTKGLVSGGRGYSLQLPFRKGVKQAQG